MKYLKYLIFIVFIGVSFLSYFYLFGGKEVDKTFLTISTFLFSIFTGFFISRQGTRYMTIREKIANFDGNMSAIYRGSGHLGVDIQNKIGEIIKKHYEAIIENKAWDYHFTHKSSTITSIHGILEESLKDQALTSLKNDIVIRITTALHDVQLIRKNMVALYQERTPFFQWLLIGILGLILLITLMTIPSQGYLLGSLLKGAFGASVISVLILLLQLDRLQFFEGTMGENSASDVVNIIAGKK